MSTNPVLDELGAARNAETKEAKLSHALRALVIALDQQYLDGKAPGEYHYSGNVMDALAVARVLTKPLRRKRPQPPIKDRATTSVGK